MSTRFHLIFQRFILFYLWLNRGAGQEVGRSCIMLEFKGKKIMVNKYQNRVYLTSIKLTSSSHLTAGLWNPSWSFWNGCIAFCGLDWGRSNWFATYFTVIIIIFKVFFALLICLIVISFHLDHCGALPWFLQKTTFKGRCFMTHATKAIYRWLLSDYIKVKMNY